MNAKVLLIASFLVASLAGCGETAENGSATSAGGTASANGTETASAGGTTVLDVRAEDVEAGIRFNVSASGIPAGEHGMHIHEVGRCDGPKFTSAGPHWNPAAKKHGRENPAGAHLGDLPNLIAGPDGRATAEFVVAGARLTEGAQPLYDQDGATLLIHAAADDYRTDPSGASGDRILCAVLQASR